MSEIIIVSSKDPVPLAPLSAGFAYGFGLFETIKFSEGCLIFWEAHWSRLQASAKVFGLNCEYAESAVLAAIRSLVEIESIYQSMIKLSLVRNGANTQLFVYARPPMGVVPDRVELKLDTEFPINPQSRLAGHKTHNYMENMSLLEDARREGFYDTIRLDLQGYLAETTIGNLFWIQDERLYTPGLRHGILPGVIRAKLAERYAVEVGSYRPNIFEDSDAAFMTNSGLGVLPISRICGGGMDCSFESSRSDFLQQVSEELLQLERDSWVRIL